MATERLPATAAAQAHEIPAAIAGSVSLLKFSEALAQAGLVGRHDVKRGILVIEPAPEARRPMAQEEDAELGMAWYNGLSRAERLFWHRIAGSAAPADAWAAWKAGRRTD